MPLPRGGKKKKRLEEGRKGKRKKRTCQVGEGADGDRQKEQLKLQALGERNEFSRKRE